MRGAHLRLAATDVGVAGVVEPRGDAVAPPELAADRPVLDVLQPVAVGVDPVRRHEFHFARFHEFETALRQRVHLHEPLVGQERLDHLAAAVAARHLQTVRLDLDQQAGGVEVGDDQLARVETIQAAVFFGDVVARRNHLRLVGEDVDHRQRVALADRVVVEVVRGGDLDHAGAEGAVHVVVHDQRDAAAGQRKGDRLAVQREVARILRMHHRRGVAEHGFRAGGGDHDVVADLAQCLDAVGIDLDVFVRGAIGQRIADRPHVAVFFLAGDLEVGDRGLQHRVPVDQALAAVDQALFVQAHEGLGDRGGGHRVHGEHAARPVAAGAEPAHLPLDGVAGLLLPLPDFLDELVAAQRVAGLAFACNGEVARDDHLGGDAGVVGAHLPQRAIATHAVVADQRVLQGVLERVAHVQRAGDVRRRQQDGIGRAVARGRKRAAAFPLLVQAGFEGFRVVARGEGGHGLRLSCLLFPLPSWERMPRRGRRGAQSRPLSRRCAPPSPARGEGTSTAITCRACSPRSRAPGNASSGRARARARPGRRAPPPARARSGRPAGRRAG